MFDSVHFSQISHLFRMTRLLVIALSSVVRATHLFAPVGSRDGIQAILEADAILSGASGSLSVQEDSVVAGPPTHTPIGVMIPGGLSILKRTRDGVDNAPVPHGPKRLRADSEDASGADSTTAGKATRRAEQDMLDHRHKIISDFLIANNKTRDRGTFSRLREIFRDDPITDGSLRMAIIRCSRALGVPIKARIGTGESLRRERIVNEFVRANTHLASWAMVPLINAKLVDEKIGAVAPRYLHELIKNALRKVSILSQLLGSDDPVAPDQGIVDDASHHADIALAPSDVGAGDGGSGAPGVFSTWPERRKKITDFLIENNRTRDRHTFPRLREIFRDDLMVSDVLLRKAILSCCRDLGMPINSYNRFSKSSSRGMNPVARGEDGIIDATSPNSDVVLAETSIAPSAISAGDSEAGDAVASLSVILAPSERHEIIRRFLIENNRTRDRHTFSRLREILRDDPIADATLRMAIIRCSRELGMPVSARSRATDIPRRNQIIREFVAANSHMLNSAMVPLINARLEAADIDPPTRAYLGKMIQTARAKLDNPNPAASEHDDSAAGAAARTFTESVDDSDIDSDGDSDDEVEILYESTNMHPYSSGVGPITPSSIQAAIVTESLTEDELASSEFDNSSGPDDAVSV